jgi:hypothetical protein
VIKEVGSQQRCLTLQATDPATPSQFQWSDETVFYDNEKAITEAALLPGQRALVSYGGRKGAWVATKIEVDAICSSVEMAAVNEGPRVPTPT